LGDKQNKTKELGLMRFRQAIGLYFAFIGLAGLNVGPVQAATVQTSTKKSTSSSSNSHRSKRSSKRLKREKGQQAPTSERVAEIQQALAKDGSLTEAPGGKWDDSTVEAVKRFQAGHGLNPTGKLDALTLQKLGLGSQTAGVAAPLPSISSSTNNTTPLDGSRK
jgi:peptidoglycan hydrolase-like protein with peptidoglycan-binding domain